MDHNESRFILTPHPVALAGQKNIPLDLRPGESLYSFLHRHVPGLDESRWVAVINGQEVGREDWFTTFPKDGQMIELRGDVAGKSVLMIVAMVALTIFTFGIGAAAAFSVYGAATAAGAGAMTATLAATAVYMAGAMLIQKVLGPKQETPAAQDTSRLNSLGGTSNQMRPYEPFGLLFGENVRIAPDVLSRPYGYFQGDDQYMDIILTPGFNVHSVGDFMNGTTPLNDYQDVKLYHNNFSGMPSVAIPMMTNTLELPGGKLSAEDKGTPGPIINRTTGPNTIKFSIGVAWTLFGVTRKGKESQNQETIRIAYRRSGSGEAWDTKNYSIRNTDKKEHRTEYTFEVPEGTYDIEVQAMGINSTGDGDQQNFQLTSIITARPDDTDYSFIPRIGINIKASGQLNGAPNELTTHATAKPTPVWTSAGWVTKTTSNPGAQILQYLRGIYSDDGELLAGMGIPDEEIDIESLKAFMLHCEANKFEYRFWITDKRSHENVIQSIANCAMGQMTTAGGKWTATWAAEEQPFTGVVNMATMTDASFEVGYTLANAADGIEYSYFDSTTEKTETVRVKSPTSDHDPINPATVSGEGVTTEKHASTLARYFLGQSLFQYKDISYGATAEVLSYKRMDKLMLQHDLTQWGFGGRVVSAQRIAGGRVQVTLDEAVPSFQTPFLGIRALGERVCRVFNVEPFVGNSKTLILRPSSGQSDVWPSDMPFPTASDAPNLIWMYDFKATPGYPVRVVSIDPDFDQQAKVAVVWEGPEFWDYVMRGTYQRPDNESSLDTSVTAQNLTARDYQVIQGNTRFTEVQLSWEVIGNVLDCNVYMSGPDGLLQQIGSNLTTRSHTVRVDYLQPYTFVVMPRNISGLPGKAARIDYLPTTMGGGPTLVDLFDVEDRTGGVRRYTWGFDSTIMSPDFDGVEIRYMAGQSNGVPMWESMIPLGDADGFFTSAVEAVIPAAGLWTFACRSRNTSGELSGGMRYLSKTLSVDIGQNVVEVIQGVEQGKSDLVQEINDRIDADIANANKAADDLREESERLAAGTAANAQLIAAQGQQLSQQGQQIAQNTNGLAQEIINRVAGDLNVETNLTTKITQETTARESDVENLARMIASVSAGSGAQFDSSKIWYFDTSVEGWGSNGGTPTIEDGFLRPINNSAAYAQSPVGLGIDGSAYRFLKLRMKRVGNPEWLGLVRWTTDADQTWNDAKSVTIPLPTFDANGIANVEIDSMAWNSGSPLRQMRIALTRVQSAINYVMYDWIAVGRPTPGASVAMVQEEAQARITADSANASSIQTLGVQMRGDYNGSDVAGVTQGLIASEKNARISGDQVNATAIQTLTARMPTGNGKVASEASVTSLQQAMVAADTALGQRVDTLTATVGGKADSAALNALTVRVTTAEGKIDSQATSITQLSSALNAVTAAGSNMILNGGFGAGIDVGWLYNYVTPATWSATEGRNNGACWKALGRTGTLASNAKANGGSTIDVTPGLTYRVSCWYKTDAEFNGATGNSKLRLGSQAGSLLGDRPFFANRGWGYVEIIYRVPDDGTITGLAVEVQRNGTAGTLWVDDVAVEEVTEVLANAQATQGLTTRVTEAEGKIEAQATQVTQLSSSLGTTNNNVTAAQNAANAAQNAADAAATAAGNKGKVLFQSATPAVADRLAQNLWIDTTNNSNTPKRWNGTAWVVVTDKAATDAAAAAAAAQAKADANAAAISAQATAISGLTTRVTQAEGKIESSANSIITLNAQIGNIGGDNLLFDSSFEKSNSETSLLPYWRTSSSGSTAVSYGVSPLTGSTRFVRVAQTLTGTSQYVGVEPALGYQPKIIPGEKYIMSAYIRGTPGHTAQIIIQIRNSADVTMITQTKNFILTSEFTRVVSDPVTGPVDAGQCRNIVRIIGNSTATAAFLEVDNVQFQLGEVATNYSTSSEEADKAASGAASAVTELRATVVQQGDLITAQAANITSLNVSLKQAVDKGDNILPDFSFEGYASEQIISTPNSGAAGEFRAKAGTAGSSCFEGVRVGLLRRTATPQTANADCYFGPEIAVVTGRTYYIEAVVRNNTFFSPVDPSDAVFNFGMTWLTSGNVRAWTAGISNRRLDSIGNWTRISAYVTATTANIRKGQLWLTIPGSMPAGGLAPQNVGVLVDNVMFLDVTDAFEAKKVADASASAVQTLSATVTGLGNTVTAQAQSITNLSSQVNGMIAMGDNLIPNSNFEQELTGYTVAGSQPPVWSATNGEGGPGVLFDRTTTSPPQLNTGNGLWRQTVPGRRYRVVARGFGVSGARNMLFRIERRQRSGSTGSEDKNLIFPANAWTTMSADFGAIPSDFYQFKLTVFCHPATAAVRLSSIELYDITDAVAIDGQATAITGLTTRVQNVEGVANANASSITQLNTKMGNFSSTVWTQMQSDITTNKNSTTALSTRVDGVVASVDGKADAAVVVTMQAQVKNQGFGGNMIPNSTFPNWSGTGWSQPSGWDGWGDWSGDTNYVPYGIRTALCTRRMGTNPANNNQYSIMSPAIPAIVGKTYCLAFGANIHRGALLVYAEFKNAAGQILASMAPTEIISTNRTAGPLAEFPRYFAIAKAPAGTVTITVAIRLRGTGEADPYLWMWQPMLCEVAEGATQPPPYSPAGNEYSSQWAVSVRADNRVGGMTISATGQSTSFDIYVDAFRISKPEGGARTEFSDGNWRVYDGNGVMRTRMGVWP